MINVSVSSFIRLAKSLLGCNLTCLPSCQTYVDPIPSETDDWGMSQHHNIKSGREVYISKGHWGSRAWINKHLFWRRSKCLGCTTRDLWREQYYILDFRKWNEVKTPNTIVETTNWQTGLFFVWRVQNHEEVGVHGTQYKPQVKRHLTYINTKSILILEKVTDEIGSWEWILNAEDKSDGRNSLCLTGVKTFSFVINTTKNKERYCIYTNTNLL